MIAVIATELEKEIFIEFFELFKTPWEFYREGSFYDIALITMGRIEEYKTPEIIGAKLIIIYGSNKIYFDEANEITTVLLHKLSTIEWNEYDVPIYGDLLAFNDANKPFLKIKNTNQFAAIEINKHNKKILRIGFDLFQEIHFLLSCGQPVENAHIPTLDIHIAILRDFILRAGITLVEIPPIPAGYNFIVCLTHDVDFIGIREHVCDYTMWGFVYRALIGSCFKIAHEKSALKKLIKNWKAVAVLPLVYLGLVKDFWDDFDRYLDIENELGSTFYFIPFKNTEGADNTGKKHKLRAVKYDVQEHRSLIKHLQSTGCEIGLHGIDAWCDASRGIQELNRICLETGESSIGVRMHWLYFDDTSPKLLEETGFLYDSTLGYNDAVGFRSGTAQVFKIPGTERLLEIPMHIQDTALFYSSRMGLNEKEAWGHVFDLIKSIQRFGGVMTINWHTRSLSPERLWDDFYIKLIEMLKTMNVWFATATQAVKWFDKRRSVSFEKISFKDDKLTLALSNINNNSGPDLLLRVYWPTHESSNINGFLKRRKFINMPINSNIETTISLNNI